MAKKVLILSGSYYPKHIGGAEVAVKEITDRISPAEFEFHMVTNRFDSTLPKVEKVGNVLVHRIGISTHEPSMAELRKFPLHLNKLFFQLTAYHKAQELHGKYAYDALWAIMAHTCAVPAALFKKKCPGVRYILTLQEGDPPEYIEKKMRLFGTYFKEGFTSADRIQTISTFLAAWAKRMGASCPVEVIPNAVDVRHFAEEYSAAQVDTLRRQWGGKPDDIFLITTSRLVHKNGIDTVIRTLPMLPYVHFVICGTGPDEHMLRSLGSELRVSERVHFVGHIDHEVMPMYLKACDIFIRISRSEGMGNSFIEAMAAGLPVIATQVGGIADFLFDEKRNPGTEPTGWAVDVEDPEGIALAVRDIRENASKALKIRENARRMVKKRYTWELIAKEMEEKIFSGI